MSLLPYLLILIHKRKREWIFVKRPSSYGSIIRRASVISDFKNKNFVWGGWGGYFLTAYLVPFEPFIATAVPIQPNGIKEVPLIERIHWWSEANWLILWFILKLQNIRSWYVWFICLFLLPTEGTSTAAFNSESSPSTDGHSDGSWSSSIKLLLDAHFRSKFFKE